MFKQSKCVRVWFRFILFAWLPLAAACGSNGDDGKLTPSSKDAGADALSSTDTSDPAGDTATAPDASTVEPDTQPPLETVSTSLKISSVSAFTTCEDACSAKDAACSGSCEDIGHGTAHYGYYDYDYGWVKVVTSVDFETCSDTAVASVEHEGETYELANVWCCCELPEVKIIDGDMANVRSCTEICADNGMKCYDHYAWSSDKSGGVKMWYQRPSTGGSAYLHAGCDAVPKPEINYANADRILMGYDCACYGSY